jgi:hypothetical protein
MCCCHFSNSSFPQQCKEKHFINNIEPFLASHDIIVILNEITIENSDLGYHNTSANNENKMSEFPRKAGKKILM